jgi:tRNA(fMet)-specific endonuclease VapC
MEAAKEKSICVAKKEERILEIHSLFENHPMLLFKRDRAEHASVIAADLRSLGEQIEIRDLFNASIYLSRGLAILTRNKSHYDRVKGLEILSS